MTASLPPVQRNRGLSAVGCRGFTLFELVAALVIVGVLVAVAVPKFFDLRQQARIAAFEGIATTLVANMNSTMAAWPVRGTNPIELGDISVPLNTTGTYVPWPVLTMPVGVPTGSGMYLMMGCGTTSPARNVSLPCASLPDYTIFVWTDDSGLDIWRNDDNGLGGCYLEWWPVYGHDPLYPIAPGSVRYATRYDYSQC